MASNHTSYLNHRLIRKYIVSGFFHFLNAFSSIILLLLIGQITSESDSAKSRILKLIFFDHFDVKYQWHWAMALLISKVLFSVLRSHWLSMTQFEIQSSLQKFWLENQDNKTPYANIGKDLKQLSKSIVKGQILWTADLVMLLFIFCILINLNFFVAISWLIFFVLGIFLRIWMVKFYAVEKKKFRTHQSKWIRKFDYIMIQFWSIIFAHQLEKETNIFNRRLETAHQSNRVYSMHRALANGFFPAYFFSFLFFIIYTLHSFSFEKTILLQLVLILIYSQSALTRCFKSPEHWRIINSIARKWNSSNIQINLKQNTQPKVIQLLPQLDKSEFVFDYSGNDIWNELIEMRENPLSFNPTDINTVTQQISFLLTNQLCTNESYLASIICSKESVGLHQLEKMIQSLELKKEWDSFDWKSSPTTFVVSENQLKWINLFKSMLHPGWLIVISYDNWIYFDENEKKAILQLVIQKNKKIILV